MSGTNASKSRFHDMLGFRAGNQDIGRDCEVSPIELLCFGDVLRGPAADSLVQIAAVVNPGELRQLVRRMSEQIYALALERMGKQDFGGQPRRRDSSFLKKRRPLPKRLAYC